MSGDRNRDRGSRDDRDRDRDKDRDIGIGRYSRDDRESSSHRRRRSRSSSREHSPTHKGSRIKRGDSPPPRHRRDRSLSPYSKRAKIKRERQSKSPEPWGSHQHDLAHDKSNPPPPPVEKQKPNYGLSGLLAAATNTKNGTVLKYNEPPEGKRTKGWRIYIFKDGKEVDVLNLDGQSSFLVGRDRSVIAHLSIAKVCTDW